VRIIGPLQAAALAGLTFACGLVLGLYVKRNVQPAAPVVHLAAERLPGGGLVLEQNPPQPPPRVKVPRGRVQTVGQVVVEPPAPTPDNPRPAVTLRLATVATNEGQRVVVESPDGKILTGAAWTVGPPAPEYRWTVQAVRSWTTTGASWGGSVAYARGNLVGSATVLPGQIIVGLGFRF